MNDIMRGRYEALRLEINEGYEKVNNWADLGLWEAIKDWEGSGNIEKYKSGFRRKPYNTIEELKA